jgi:hypothetical protein
MPTLDRYDIVLGVTTPAFALLTSYHGPEKISTARQMSAKGQTVPQIARALDVRRGTVRDWLRGRGGRCP